MSMVDGDARIERIEWDNFNEGLTLQGAVERVLGAIWILSRSSAGRQTVSHTSKLAVLQSARHPTSGRKLGRPAKDDEPTHKQIERQDAPERNAIEGKFGEGKRNGLGLIRDTAQGDQRERDHDADPGDEPWTEATASVCLHPYGDSGAIHGTEFVL